MSRHRPLWLFPFAARPWPLFLALTFAAALAGPRAASAGSNTWFSGATSGSWQTTSHWGNGLLNTIVPGATSGTTNTDTATFDSASNTTAIVPDANRNLKFITFDTAAAAYTIGTTGGNALLMTNGGMIEIASTFSATNRTETIDAPLVLEGNYTLADNSANAGVLLDFGGAITNGAAGGIALTVTGAGNTTISGAIGGGGARSIALAKSGAGTLILNGNNAFAGVVTINAGTLQIDSSSVLGPAVTFGSGSTGSLILNLGAIRLSGLSTNITLGSPVVQPLNGGGQVSLEIDNVSDSIYAGVLKDGTGVSDTLGVVKNGAGTLTLSGNNTFTGGVTIYDGTLRLGNAGALNASGTNFFAFGSGSTGTLSLNGNSVTIPNLYTSPTLGSPVIQNAGPSPATLTIASAVSITYPGVLQDGPGGGALALVVNMGLSTLTLSGNNNLSGGVTINSGTLRLGSAGALNGASGVTFPAGSTGNLILAGNSATISALSGSNTEDKVSYPAVQNSNATPATLTVDNSSASLFNGELQDAGGGPLSLVKSGAGTLTLGPAYGSNTFTGSVTINAGVLYIGRNSLNSAAPNVVTFGPASTGVLGLLDDVTVSGLSTNSNVGTPAVTGDGLSAAVWTLTVNNAAESVFAGRLLDGPSRLGLLKSGAGTLTLSGNNSFTGGLTINAGTVQLGSAGALNSTSNPLKFAASSTGTLTLYGYSAAVGGLDTNVPLGTPVVQNASAAPAPLAVNIAANSSTYAGILQDGPGSGALSLTKSGAGALLLNGNDTYTGGTTVIGGSLNTSGNGTLGTGPLTISAANGITSAVVLGHSQTVSSLSGTLGGNGFATLSIGSGVTLTDNQSSGNTNFQGALINSGTFAKAGSSSLELNTAPTLNANSTLQVNGGTLRFNFVTGAATIGSGVTATVASGATLQLAGPISALSSGTYRVNIANDSNSTGLLVSDSNQHVGNIDGSGTTQVNAGCDLTANRIIQSALVIGGTAASAGAVTIAPSDASGNPLDAALGGPLGQSSGFVVAGSLTPRGPFGAGGSSFANSSGADSELASLSPISSVANDNQSSVPEPSTLLLVFVSIAGLAGQGIVMRRRALHDD